MIDAGPVRGPGGGIVEGRGDLDLVNDVRGGRIAGDRKPEKPGGNIRRDAGDTVQMRVEIEGVFEEIGQTVAGDDHRVGGIPGVGGRAEVGGRSLFVDFPGASNHCAAGGVGGLLWTNTATH